MVRRASWRRAATPTPASLERNALLPSAVGAARPSALVPVTMAGGDLRSDDPVCVVGLRPLKDFHAALLADNLTRQGVPGRAVELDLQVDRVDQSALGLARAFDRPEVRSLVAAQLAVRLRPRERVAFPAVLGLRHAAIVHRELEEQLGRRVFEVPTLPPSVPGAARRPDPRQRAARRRRADHRRGGDRLGHARAGRRDRAREGRGPRGGAQRELARARDRRLRRGLDRAGARTGSRARRCSACRSPTCPGPASRASCRTTSTTSRCRARASRSTRACGPSARTARACTSACSWRARRSAAPCPGRSTRVRGSA